MFIQTVLIKISGLVGTHDEDETLRERALIASLAPALNRAIKRPASVQRQVEGERISEVEFQRSRLGTEQRRLPATRSGERWYFQPEPNVQSARHSVHAVDRSDFFLVFLGFFGRNCLCPVSSFLLSRKFLFWDVRLRLT